MGAGTTTTALAAEMRGRIARLVRAAQEKSELSVEDLALRAGIAPRTLYRRLEGNSAWTIDEVAYIAAILDVPVSSLLNDGVPSDVTTHAIRQTKDGDPIVIDMAEALGVGE